MSFRLEHSTTMGIRRQILWFHQPVLYSMRREVFGTSAHRKTMKPIIDTNLAAGRPRQTYIDGGANGHVQRLQALNANSRR